MNGGRQEGDECATAAPSEVERELHEDDGGVAVASVGSMAPGEIGGGG